MSSPGAREEVLDRLRSALGADHRDAPGPVPRDYRRRDGRAAGDPGLVDVLVDRLEDYKAGVHRCTPEEVPAVVARLLRERRDHPARSLAVPTGLDMTWTAAATGVEVRPDHPAAPMPLSRLDATDSVLTACAVAVADTGTIVLDASPDQGRRALTLVPDHHVVVVRADQVVGLVPEALARLDPTRPLTWISGPSATSDIELDRVEGVHGPRTLDVVVVDGRA
ncbi:LutC/YkgG family protein [Aquipuribacter nitratireducens]|uniref:Lactate utilization protein C n=1 Tax=Aquipuribacter nitratireducens TaxID=650104 RepID=A0ABW0GJD1_9MICO